MLLAAPNHLFHITVYIYTSSYTHVVVVVVVKGSTIEELAIAAVL